MNHFQKLDVWSILLILAALTFAGFSKSSAKSSDSSFVVTGSDSPALSDSIRVTNAVPAALTVQNFTRFTGQSLSSYQSVFELPDGSISFRGLGPFNSQFPDVLVDGQRLASTGFENRSTNFSGIPRLLFSEIRTITSPTPEFSSVSSGSLVLLNTNTYETASPGLTFSAGGGLQGSNRDFLTPDSRFSLFYSDAVADQVDFFAGVYQDGFSSGTNTLRLQFAAADFGNGMADVIDRIHSGASFNRQLNRGAFFNTTIRQSETTSYRINGFVNQLNADVSSHHYFFNSGTDWISPQETGATGNRGQLDYLVGVMETRLLQSALSANVNLGFNRFQMRFTGGWSFGGNTGSDLTIPFRAGALNYVITEERAGFPVMEVSNREIRNQDLRIEQMRDITHVQNEHILNTGLDVEYRVDDVFSVHTGALFTNVSKKGSFKNAGLRLLALSSVANFRQLNGQELTPFDEPGYRFMTMVSPVDAQRFFRNNYSLFRQDLREQIRLSDYRNYGHSEQEYAGYLMLYASHGIADIRAGARVWHTEGSYTGKKVGFNEIGNHSGTTDTTATAAHTYVLPFAASQIRLAEKIAFNSSLSTSLYRQDYRSITPFRLENVATGNIFEGNSSLKPALALHIDAGLLWSGIRGGDVRIGGFYSSLQNLVIETESVVTAGDESTRRLSGFANNSENAQITGIEASWNQALLFLPGILGNTGFTADYTLMNSSYRPRAEGPELAFTGVPDYVYSASVYYMSPKFSISARLSHVASFTAAYIIPEIDLIQLPSAELQEVRTTDYTLLSVSASFNISTSVSLWVDASNMLPVEFTEYSVSENTYPWQRTRYQRDVIMAGFQLSF
ncbi:MAG: hypothetical protein EA364_09605 [Balneolaceae bacterium]|nr:MAG: hypothetical protein EA364_09605 [Balneolaceae bacterium]